MLANSEPEIISFVEEERRAFKRVKSMDKNGEQIASAVVSLNSSPGVEVIKMGQAILPPLNSVTRNDIAIAYVPILDTKPNQLKRTLSGHSDSAEPIKIVDQPDHVQVANYNVQPLLTIELTQAVKVESSITAELVEESTNSSIYKGFKSGDVQAIPVTTKTVSFYGLKINRVGALNDELARINSALKVKECSFHIKLTVDGNVIKSNPFKLVSSYTQLPKDLQEKRQARTTRGN